MDIHPNKKKLFYEKNLLCIDYGSKVVGLGTFSPSLDPYPCPWGKLLYSQDVKLISDIKKILMSELIDAIVIGIPYFLDGKETDMGRRIRAFGERLQKEVDCPLYYQDETLSTYEAKNRMINSPAYGFKIDYKKIDALAASIILEDFMRSDF